MRSLIKLFVHTVLYYSGAWYLLRLLRSAAGRRRAGIVLYHRVNDDCDDPLTVSRLRFAEHLMTLKKYYRVVTSDELVAGITQHKPPARAACIHFDDCYKDVYVHAGALLRKGSVPATAFISSGFIGTERRFQHDVDKYPLVCANLSEEDVISLADSGIAVGSHTVNHIDLGGATHSDVRSELAESKQELERITQSPITLFSFPFGSPKNRPTNLDLVAWELGYKAIFSAYGGAVTSGTALSDIPRFGADDSIRPIDLLMEMEGISCRAWAQRFTRLKKVFS